MTTQDLRHFTIQRIRNSGLIAVLRCQSAKEAVQASMALADAGVEVLEIALTTPGGLEALSELKKTLADRCLLGAGTVLTPRQAIQASDAGAEFIFAPNVDPEVIRTASELGRVAVPGALTPTEVALALKSGADLIKLFPANQMGPSYIKDLQGPYPQVQIIPTGGVDLSNLADWLHAGAWAVGIGTCMIPKDLVRNARWEALTTHARPYAAAVKSTLQKIRPATGR